MSGKKRKVREKPVQKTTLFTLLPDAPKTLIRAEDLRRQREAALRDEDYEVEALNMATFKSEQAITATHETAKVYACSKCPRTFETRIVRRNHYYYTHNEKTMDLPLLRGGGSTTKGRVRFRNLPRTQNRPEECC